jgi:hypothetical protein
MTPQLSSSSGQAEISTDDISWDLELFPSSERSDQDNWTMRIPTSDSSSAPTNSSVHGQSSNMIDPELSLMESDADALRALEDGWINPAQESSIVPTGQVATSAIDVLASVIGGLRLDDQSGQTGYVGPTSNLHLRSVAATLGIGRGLNRDEGNQSRVSYRIGLLKDDLEAASLTSFWTQFHPHVQIFGSPSNGFAHAKERRRSDAVYCMMLAIGSCFLDTRDTGNPLSSLQARSQFYVQEFASLLGHEVDHLCLQNVQAFTLRAYLAILYGQLGSATIFSGIRSSVELEHLWMLELC